MATMHLLKASIKGSIGAHTGTTLHGKPVIKGRIWSKTPPNTNQCNNVRSFEALNRLSSAITKQFWQWLGLSDKKMLKHNATAQYFKPLIKNHIFEPENIKDIIPAGDNLQILTFDTQASPQKLVLQMFSKLGGLPLGSQSAIVVVFNQIGQVVFCHRLTTQVLDLSLAVVIDPAQTYYCLAFSSSRTQWGYVLGDCQLLVQYNPHLFNTNNYKLTDWYVVDPAAAATDSENVIIENSYFIMP